MEKRKRITQEKLDEIQRIKDSEKNFWKNFIQMKEDPTFSEKVQNLFQKIRCCNKSNKVENKNNTRADGVKTRDTGSGPGPSNLGRISKHYPLPFASNKLYVLPAIAKRNELTDTDKKTSIPKKNYQKITLKKTIRHEKTI